MNVKSGFQMLKETFREWKEDEALQLGAALAYYTIFSIAPMLLVVISVAGLVWEREAVQGQIVQQAQGLVGRDGAEAIQTMVVNAGKREGTGILATVIGLVTILFGATGVFAQLQSSLNHIWNVEPKPGAGVKGLLKVRLVSFGMILAIGFLLLVSLVISAGLAALDSFMGGLMPAAHFLVSALAFLVGFAVITLLFALIYRFLPDVRIAWRDVWIGAAFTSLLFVIGKFLIGLYLGNSSVGSTYGAAGSLVVLLLWIYYSTQILFFGAEFTQVYAKHRGSHIVPNEHAVKVREVKEMEEDGDKQREPEPRRRSGRPVEQKGRA